jgi:hypothetical protein
MVNSGTGHDRCPSGFPGPIRRPSATLRWRLKNYKTRFWFQGGGNFFALIWIARPRRYGRAGRGALTTLPFAVSYLRARRTARSSFCSCFPHGVLCWRALFQCGPLGRVAWSNKPSEV